MSPGMKGEGGTIVLGELLNPLLRGRSSRTALLVLTVIGVSFLMGDGVITPAISILSAVEGLPLIPGREATAPDLLILLAAGIATALFAFQRRGTERVAFTFGPIMVVWYAVLTLSGLLMIARAPVVLFAINPAIGLGFLFSNGLASFLILASVILCPTGGEALYADMAHLGRDPIRRAWAFAFPSLVINYLGQGAFALARPEAGNILFEMVPALPGPLHIPFVLLSIVATVIASQAMISGVFSVVYQGITTHILPLMKIDYTSKELRSQTSIGIVNWLPLAAVLPVTFAFRASANLAAAYGLAVTGTMALTRALHTVLLLLRRSFGRAVLAGGLTIVDLAFRGASSSKLETGGYWLLPIATVP